MDTTPLFTLIEEVYFDATPSTVYSDTKEPVPDMGTMVFKLKDGNTVKMPVYSPWGKLFEATLKLEIIPGGAKT